MSLVALPAFLSIEGTLNKPERKLDYAALTAIAARAAVATGLVKGSTGGALNALGNILSGEKAPAERLQLAAMGMEAEFTLCIDDEPVKPEDVFGDPRAGLRRNARLIRSPTGAVVFGIPCV